MDLVIVRRLNDSLRSSLQGGRVMFTNGVACLDDITRAEVLKEVCEFNDFTEDNDPHQEHDFGSFIVGDELFYFKIDYYDNNLEYHSPDPSDPSVTCRVLTIMYAQEY